MGMPHDATAHARPEVVSTKPRSRQQYRWPVSWDWMVHALPIGCSSSSTMVQSYRLHKRGCRMHTRVRAL